MSVKLDSISHPAGTAAERNGVKARQDKWMLEIEKAMMASGQPHPAAQTHASAAAAMPAAAPATAAVAGVVGSPGADRPAGAANRARVAAAAGPATSAGGSQPGGAATGPAGATAASGSAPTSAGGGAPTPRSSARTGRAPGAATDAGVPAGALLRLAGMAPGPMDASVLVPGAAVAGAAAGAGMGEGGTAPGLIGSVAAAMPQLFSFGAGMAAMTDPAAQAPGNAAPPETEPDGTRDGAAASFASDEREPYGLRNLHVMIGADGVQAWVRDAQLAPERGQMVAQAIAAQFIEQGTAVVSVTVNGRNYGTRPAADGDEPDGSSGTHDLPARAGGLNETSIVRGAA